MHPLLKDATEEQRAVIQHLDGPGVVSASPGSGKCIQAYSIIPTSKGLIQISQIPKHFPVGRNGACRAKIVGGNSALEQLGPHQTSHWFDMGMAPSLRIETDAGYMVKGTHEHPIVVLDQAGDLQFKCLRDVVIGDVACIARSTDQWGTNEMDLDLAYMLGMLVGDGVLSGKNYYIGISRDHAGMEAVFRQTMEHSFGITKVKTTRHKGGKKGAQHGFYSKATQYKLEDLGLPMVRSPFRYVPETIMMGTREVVVSFLQGLFDTESSVNLHNWEYTTASIRLAREVQALLLNLGIRVSFANKPVKAYPDNDYFRLHVSGESIRRYADVGLFRCHEEKMARLAKVVAKPHNPNKDLVLGQKDRIRRLRDRYLNKLPNWHGRKGAIVEEDGSVFRLSRFINGHRNPSHNSIDRILKHVPAEDPDAKHLRMLSREFILEPIVKVDDVGDQHVYDFTVPKSHSFVGNGFINHNTRAITYRIAYLLDHGVQPKNIIGITFTNKAANEMKERVSDLAAAHMGHKVWLSTFHSFCNRLMRANPIMYGVEKNFGIADDTDAKQFMTLAMAKIEGVATKEIKTHSGAGDVNHVRKWVSTKKDLVLTPADVDAYEATGGKQKFFEFNRYYREYQRSLRRNNLMDFDDMIMRVVWKLRKNPDEQARFAEHVHYLMVDEYQDTNYAQFELVRLISHMRKNVLTVGDSDQSIYGWRGADADNVKRFYKTFPDTATYMLQTNFRSVPGIAAVANKVIANNTRLHPKTIVTHKQTGPDPVVIAAENPEKEAMLVMNSIKGLIQSDKNDWTWKDFACIYRIRSASRALEDAAVRLNIPYRVVGALNFYNRASTKDILSYCRLVQYPHDDSAFTRVYNKPTRGIGPANFNRFAGQADMHDYSLMKTLRKGLYTETAKGAALSGFRKLKRLYRDIRRQGTDEAAPIIERIIMNSGYMFYAENIRDSGRSDRMVEDLHELVEAATVYDVEHKGKKKHGIVGFLEHVALIQLGDRNKNKEDNDVVTLMTAHAAKGLEFPCVFVCGAVDGVMPLNPRSEDGTVMSPEAVNEHYEEERRVFYVAITRAEERLVITYPMIRRFGPNIVNTRMSQFCTEAGDTLEINSMVDSNKSLQMSAVPRRQFQSKRRGPKIKDGGVQDILLQRERRHLGTATKGDMKAMRRENDRRRSTGVGEPE